MTASDTDPAGKTVLTMVHRDSHVGIFAANEAGETQVRSMNDLIRRVGIQGWRLQRLSPGDAIARHLSGLNCPVCALVLPCGCSVLRAVARQCPHDSVDRIHRLAHETGYCSDDHPAHQGPPLEDTDG